MLLHCSPVQATGLTTLIRVRGGLKEQPKTATGRGAQVPDMERLRLGMCDCNRPDPNRKAGNADLEGKERQGYGASQTMMGKRQLRPDPVKARRQNSKYPGRGTTPVRARSDRSQTKGERITQWPGGPQSEPARGAKGHTQETVVAFTQPSVTQHTRPNQGVQKHKPGGKGAHGLVLCIGTLKGVQVRRSD